MAQVLKYSSGVSHFVPDELAAEALRRAKEIDAHAVLTDAPSPQAHSEHQVAAQSKVRKQK